MARYKNMAETIGNTPLVELSRYAASERIEVMLLGKVESFNPAGSIKDRVALSMINQAEADGLLTKDSVLIEPTSGNTGIGLCAIAASRGYRVIITMPETMSLERQKLMTAYGAELVLTEGALGMTGAIQKAKELARAIPHALIAGQFVNPANPAAHINTTGPEIWEDTNGEVDILVAGVGTGGTITGIGAYLKEKNSAITVVAVEPSDSPVLSGGEAGSHGLQGIGAGFVPDILDTNIYDEIVTVDTQQAYDAARKLASTEGLLVGISSGAALFAAVSIARLPENKDKTIVVILPDTGERYLSTDLY